MFSASAPYNSFTSSHTVKAPYNLSTSLVPVDLECVVQNSHIYFSLLFSCLPHCFLQKLKQTASNLTLFTIYFIISSLVVAIFNYLFSWLFNYSNIKSLRNFVLEIFYLKLYVRIPNHSISVVPQKSDRCHC